MRFANDEDEPLRTLVLVYMTGCEACAEAKPIVKQFAESHAGECDVKMVDLTALPEDIDEQGMALTEELSLLPPDSVPAYVVLYADGTAPRTCSSRGVLSLDELRRWVFAI